jgi:hypothetical protein
MNGGLSVSPRAGAASFSSAVSSFAVAVSQVEIPVEADSGPSHRADLVAPKSNSAHRQSPWRRMMRFANPRHALMQRKGLSMSLSSAKNYALRASKSQDQKDAIELLSQAILELAMSIETTDAKLKKMNKTS